MRNASTAAENMIRSTILGHLDKVTGVSAHICGDITDRPDIVIVTDVGARFGVEISRLGYEKFMKWLAMGTPNDSRRKAKVIVNLDKQIQATLKNKNKKYLEYKRLRKLDEVWLCLHNDLYEFNVPPSNTQLDAKWFQAESWHSCRKHHCKFDRVFFFSENSKQYLDIYEKSNQSYRPPTSTTLPIIEFIEISTVLVDHANIDVNESFRLVDEKTFG